MSFVKLLQLMHYVSRIPAAIKAAELDINRIATDHDLSKKADDALEAVKDFVETLEGSVQKG